MTEKIDEYLNQKTIENLKDKYFDEYVGELELFKTFPKYTQIAIYFEYWFLLKKLTNQKVSVELAINERESIGITMNMYRMDRLVSRISSNGCISVYSPANSSGIFDLRNIFDIDFNYFNHANPTYKVGKFTTDEIFNVIIEPDENKEVIEKMYALVVFLKEQLTKKNNS